MKGTYGVFLDNESRVTRGLPSMGGEGLEPPTTCV